jgi:regulator of protease activity HflC (stomatin/prohibitin superfamily)
VDWSSIGSLVVTLLVVVVVVGGLGFVLMNSLYVVREYERLVVFRLGHAVGARGPGLVVLIPGVERPVRVDLREQFLAISHQQCITKDNAPIAIDFLIYWRVLDPTVSVIEVSNFAGASQGLATTTLRAVIGDLHLDDVLANRDRINQMLRQKLDEVTERWGVKVTTVEIRDVLPPQNVQEAMNRQLSAERNRRATVTESDGKREAAILVAEGEKQSAILRAEGARQAAILEAEGARQSQALRAEGFALALKSISEVARGLDGQTMGLQYLDALKMLGSSPATKLLLPLEFANMLRPVMDLAQQATRTDGLSGKGA